MRRAASESAFFTAPEGLFLAEGSAAYWCWTPDLWGATVVGYADARTVDALIGWIQRERSLRYPLHSAVFDLRGLRGIDPVAFLKFAEVIREPAIRSTVGRGAVIPPRGSGLAEAAVVGATAILEARREWVFVESLHAALDCLGMPMAASAIESVLSALLREESLVACVERLLETDARTMQTEGTARQLGLSARTLQRRLRDAGETMASIRQRVLIRSAQRLLVDTDHKVAWIAAELGFPSASWFTRVFRRETGVSPTEWRDRRGASVTA